MTIDAPWRSVPIVENEVVRAAEAAGSTDSDISQFRRLTGGDRPEDLDQSTFERYQRLAGWLYYQNPLARRLCDVVTDMVLGAGVKTDVEKSKVEGTTTTTRSTRVEATEAKDNGANDVKRLITRFLEHPANEFNIRLPGLFTSLASVHGELFLPVFVHPGNGDMALGFLEHHLVETVVFNPKNRMEAVAVIQRPPGAGQKPIWWNVIRAEQGKDQPEYPPHPMLAGEEEGTTREIVVPAGAEAIVNNRGPQDFQYGGELFYFRTNVIGTGRGRTALEPALDWLHAYDNFLFGDLRNANLQGAFVWDVTITGADEPALRAKANSIRANPPRHGEVLVHNEKEVWEAKSPNLNAASHSELGSQVKRVIGLSMGLPPHLIGAEDKTNRTTATSSDIPFVRRMEQRQTLLEYLICTILNYMLDQKRHKTVLSSAMRPYPYKVVLPSVTIGEIVAAAEALYNTTEAVIQAKNEGLIPSTEARRIFYLYGLREADVPPGLEDQIEQERKDGILSDPVQLKKDEMELKASVGPAGGGGDAGPGRVKRAKTAQGGPGGAARGRG